MRWSTRIPARRRAKRSAFSSPITHGAISRSSRHASTSSSGRTSPDRSRRTRIMTFPSLTDADHAAFWRDGYVVRRGFFDAEEIGLLQAAIDADEGIRSHVVAVNDSKGASTELALWNHPGDDLFGAF